MHPIRRLSAALAIAGAVSLAGCGGSSSEFTPAFTVESVSVASDQVWQINRPIDLTFNFDVDFATVNLNTINVRRVGGAPATGVFSMLDARTVRFQPVCPVAPDYADAGFLPGDVPYAVTVVGSNSGLGTVRSLGGRSVANSKTVTFRTPASLDANAVFIDPIEGAPRPVVGTSDAELDTCYLEVGGDATPAARVYFRPRTPSDANLGAETPADFRSPLNLYSAPDSKIAVVVVLNQPIDPSTANVTADNLRLEYRVDATTWSRVPHRVELVANCTATGAIVRIEPTGILPQGHAVRAVLSTEFKDLIGQTNPLPITVGSFEVATAVDPGTNTPGDGADEILEEFAIGGAAAQSREDTTSATTDPRAEWGTDDALTAGFSFRGTGGPGGQFDVLVTNEFFLDTTFKVIPNSTGTLTQAVVNGLVDVRNFTVAQDAKLIIQGPNTCTIFASGTVRIDGTIEVNGTRAKGVASFNTTNIPEVGASGQAGGGKGGTSTYLTNQSTPVGESGYGAFNSPGGGGGGGETTFKFSIPGGSTEDECLNGPGNRRAGGGGGGRFGADVPKPGNNPNGCPDQSIIGLDAEDGFRGSPCGNSAVRGSGQPALGGVRGPVPFFDDDASNPVTLLNNFWGTMLTATGVLEPLKQTTVLGELPRLWAGAGGGAGGNGVNSDSFPLVPFSVTGDEKGAGGAGGGGGLAILSLGDIVFGAKGRLECTGGPGGAGENTINLNHIGGGSGGGSGGHVVLQTASKINFAAARSTQGAGILAMGGQGGAGAHDRGGATIGGHQTDWTLDALPPNSYPTVTNPEGIPIGPCAYPNPNGNIIGDGWTIAYGVGNVLPACGGDGGPGIVQLHVPSLADIVLPTASNENLFKLLKPPPIGATPNNVNTPTSPTSPWNQLLPVFGRKSTALSKWIPVGLASVQPGSPTPGSVKYLFGGTNTGGVPATAGKILTSGSGATAQTAELDAILTGTISNAPARPYIVENRTVVLDASALADDIYQRNPNLVKRFALKLTHAGITTTFEVASASYDASLDELRLTVSAGGTPLIAFGAGDEVKLHPRFFLVRTDGLDRSLPSSSAIQIRFQGAPETSLGMPNEAMASSFTADITTLNSHPEYRFIRFQVNFDIRTDGQPLTFDTPVPSIEFFRMPLRF